MGLTLFGREGNRGWDIEGRKKYMDFNSVNSEWVKIVNAGRTSVYSRHPINADVLEKFLFTWLSERCQERSTRAASVSPWAGTCVARDLSS